MNKQFIFTLLSTIILQINVLKSQIITLEQNAPNVKWLQMNSDHFKLIFPTSYQKEAPKVMQYLEAVYQPAAHGLGVLPKKIPIIIQNNNVQSNGFVDPILFRSEFFLTPPQNSFGGTTDWMGELAVHEYRHIVQQSKLRKGSHTKFFNYLLGDLGVGIVDILAPSWFAEGDAVGTETALTPSGRGRVPDFDVELRTLLLNKKPYNFATAMNGSYKKFVPNHYVYGYYMTSYLKNKYGATVFDTLLNRTYSFKSLFRGSTKKVTGINVPEWYNRTIAEAKDKWTQQLNAIEETKATILSHRKTDVWTNYNYPQRLPDGRILAVRNGLGDVAQFVVFDLKKDKNQQKETVIHTLGNALSAGTLSTEKNKIVWSEVVYDPRYALKEYAVVKIMDIPTGEVTQLTHKTKYQAPALSPDASKIVVVENTPNGANTLVIIDAKTGETIKRLPNPNNALLLQPKWSENSESIVAITLLNQIKSLISIDINSGEITELMNVKYENIANPMPIKGYIFYNSPVNGIDNIYAFDTQTKVNYQVTSRKSGAYNVSGNDKELIFNDYQLEGNQIALMPFEPDTWKIADFDLLAKNKVFFFNEFKKQELTNNVFAHLTDKQFPITKFNSLKNGLRPYTWGLGIQGNEIDITAPKIGIGFADLLRTTLVRAAIGYDVNEQNAVYYTGINYEKWLPKLSLSYENAFRTGRGLNATNQVVTDRYNIKTLELGATLPLILTRSKYRQQLNIGAFFAQNQVSNFDLINREITQIPNGTFQNVRYNLSYSLLHKTSSLDIAPQKGFSVALNYRSSPFNTRVDGRQFAVNTRLYLHGIGKHHAILLRYAFQNETQSSFKFANSIVQPRGATAFRAENLNVFTAEYKMPLIYPDLAIGTVANIKRLKTAIWTDYAVGKTKNVTTQNQTIGIDLTADIGFLSFYFFPLDIGARTIYDVKTKQLSVVPLVFNIGF